MALSVAAAGGCGGPVRSGPASETAMTVERILDRAEGVYTSMQSLEARGYLRDYRGKSRKITPIQWEFKKPEYCRLQLGMNMALVKGRNWWSYDAETERFKSHKETNSTPAETAAYFLSDGIPFLLPAAWNRPRVAFGPSDSRTPWRLDGVAWTASRPCYVVSREGLGRDSGSRWTLWIDQDRFLIVAWTWDVRVERENKPPVERTVWGCTYEVINTNANIPTDRFRIEKPLPIVLPKQAPSDAVRPGN